MTIVEASEEILRGNPYPKCNMCAGSGERKFPVSRLNPNTGQLKRDAQISRCGLCSGKGYVTRGPYKEAAKLLGLEMPKPPKSMFGRL